MVPSVEETIALRRLAESAAGQAGRELAANQGRWSRAERVAGHDVKVRGDVESETLLARLLGAATGYAVFGEESGLIGDAGGDWVWVIDPLDGTANYERGVPACCVSVALCRRGIPVIGVVYDFNRDEMFSGVVASEDLDGVAMLNGRNMRVSRTAHRAQGILATGFPVASDFDASALGDYVRSVQNFRKVRSLGSAALMLAYVACGRFDAYVERNVRFWDVAAGMVLVQAAGGTTSDTSAVPGFARKLTLHASNGILVNTPSA